MSNQEDEELVVVKGAVPSYLKLQFKVLCAQRGLKMSSVLEQLLKRWIQAGGPISSNLLPEEDPEDVKGYVPKSLKLQFKVICTQQRVKMRHVLYQIINEWVQSGGFLD
ncbi:MAG: hypothetical protein F6K36_04495 [Symploca sp. SIO3C6]|uniref:Uncharacterized protein n=1 Tax=Symploca sp. SIO1C4 TaxID=2607765 RepID=A0A6B3N970_9CYAN|nr:hypothetical protein [Symploca sp. SIO3C6]NER30156.1 hypothetical protein [Symploca sp. SIO1C4]NET06044.1 hypothetical protein [Symploca sp. SIO2B6]